MTEWVAEQYGEQDKKGTLEVGKLADLVILDQDPLRVAPSAIKDIRVVETIKEGVTIFPAPADFQWSIPVSNPSQEVTRIWRAHVCDMAEVNQAAGKDWTLVWLNGQPISAQKPPTMKFERGRVSIFGGVNRLSGAYALIGESVTLGELISTRMAGPPDAMELESQFAKVMSTVDGFHVRGDNLELLSAGQVVAKFRTNGTN